MKSEVSPCLKSRVWSSKPMRSCPIDSDAWRGGSSKQWITPQFWHGLIRQWGLSELRRWYARWFCDIRLGVAFGFVAISRLLYSFVSFIQADLIDRFFWLSGEDLKIFGGLSLSLVGLGSQNARWGLQLAGLLRIQAPRGLALEALVAGQLSQHWNSFFQWLRLYFPHSSGRILPQCSASSPPSARPDSRQIQRNHFRRLDSIEGAAAPSALAQAPKSY